VIFRHWADTFSRLRQRESYRVGRRGENVAYLRVEEVAFVEADGIQDGGDLAEVLVDDYDGASMNESAAGARHEDAVQVARVIEPRTVHVVLRTFDPATVQLHSAIDRSR